MTASSGTQFLSGYRSGGVYLPADAVAAVSLAVVTDVLLVSSDAGGNLLVAPLSGLLLFFLPGYAALSALFPRSPSAEGRGGVADWATPSGSPLHTRSLTLSERLALSIGLSVALLPVVALALAALEVGYAAPAISGALTVLVFAGMVVGTLRRWRLPEPEQFRLRPRARLAAATGSLTDERRATLVTTVLVGMAALVAVSTVGMALVVPNDGESYTNVAVLTENESGDLVKGDYPRNLTAGESAELVLSVTNREDRPVEYAAAAQLQRVDRDGGSINVTERSRLAAFDRSLDDGETWEQTHTVEPAMNGTEMRLTYLVYRGDLPADPTADSAYRKVHIWLTVAPDG